MTYKRLGDYIREMNVRNREQRAMQAYAFEEGSEMTRRRFGDDTLEIEEA